MPSSRASVFGDVGVFGGMARLLLFLQRLVLARVTRAAAGAGGAPATSITRMARMSWIHRHVG